MTVNELIAKSPDLAAEIRSFLRDVEPLEMLAPAPPRLPQLGDYEILEELGRGGMGVVYRAEQRSTGRVAAVKIIRPAAAATVDAMQLFLREARILSKLRHPRIVEYLSLGLGDGQMYLAMEYLPVVDFPQLLATQSRPRQIRLVAGIMSRVLEALQHAHEHHVVHRDVKPSNILVYKSNGRLHVKLADFGLAKNFERAGLTSITCERDVRGTLGYMSPEQLLDSRYAGPPCDIYSAGACLYYFLSGQRPHDFEDRADAIVRITTTRPRPLAELAPDVPLRLCRAVDRALACDPKARYSSAAEFGRLICRFAEKPPTT